LDVLLGIPAAGVLVPEYSHRKLVVAVSPMIAGVQVTPLSSQLRSAPTSAAPLTTGFPVGVGGGPAVTVPLDG
jgi:hypothetical protein